MYVPLFLQLFPTDSLTMAQAYPQGRPQEDPRVPLPWYVTRTLVDVSTTYDAMLESAVCGFTNLYSRGSARGQEGLQPSQAR
jgi:hypothetical protein